jgi:hypothetical protein
MIACFRVEPAGYPGIRLDMVSAPGVPAVVTAAANRFAQTTRGIFGFRLHRVFDVHAGPSSRHDDLVFDGVFDDGRIVSVRVVSYTIGGKQADAQQRSQIVQQWAHPKPDAVFHPPFDRRYLPDYRYRPQSGRTVAFTALVKNNAHGSGTFTYDRADNVTSDTYVPSVMPPYATSGTITDRRQPVLPGYWAVTRETQQYSGRYALWRGGAAVEMTYSRFRRFRNLAAADRALAAGF